MAKHTSRKNALFPGFHSYFWELEGELFPILRAEFWHEGFLEI